MASFKVAITLFCVLLINETALGVLNKSSSKNKNDEENKISHDLEDRISTEYGPPPRVLDGPRPVYGPPEITGHHGPQKAYPPPPPDVPPPQLQILPRPPSRPVPVYGPPRTPQQFPPFFIPRPVKVSPWKLTSQGGRFPIKNGLHGPPIPLSLETYGPPSNYPAPIFSRPANQYGPPQLLSILPAIPQSPPPGVPAPPTPPEITYDGWQPIAGHVEIPFQQQQQQQQQPQPHLELPQPEQQPPPPQQPSPQPEQDQQQQQQQQQLQTPPNNAQINVPSDSYGAPIRSQEDHNLRQAVSTSSESGLPPPPLPEHEPFHNIQEPAKSIDTLPNLSDAPTTFASFDNDIANHINTNDDSASSNQQQLPLVSDSYGPPPPPSPSPAPAFNPNGPYPSAGDSPGYQQSLKPPHRQQHSFNSFPHQRNPPPPSYRPHSPSGNFNLPTKNRAPLKFREPNLLNSIHRYRPSFGSNGPPIFSGLGPVLPNFHRQNNPFQQQLPLNNAAPFKNIIEGGNSPLTVPSIKYGIPLTFTNFNTPAPVPVPTYGAPNFGHAASSVIGVSGGANLYQKNINNGFPTTYGVPLTPFPQQNLNSGLSGTYGVPQSQKNINAGLSPVYGAPLQLPQGDCSQKNSALNNLNAEQSQPQYRQPQFNADSIPAIESDLQLPLINQLELEPYNALPQVDIKDSYGNPAGASIDLRSAQTSPVYSASSAEALTAALTAQGYGAQPSDNSATNTNELNIDQLAQLQSEPALALAQTLSAEGAADGFQIQGSQGTYTLQIQPANQQQANENSDGTIRHDQLLSNGLLQDILAAIEQPGQGGPAQLISIQGSPQTQQAPEHRDAELQQDLAQSASSSAVNAEANPQPLNTENVALFFNDNANASSHLDDTNKETRSTAKNEAVLGATTSQNSTESSAQTSQPAPQA